MVGALLLLIAVFPAPIELTVYSSTSAVSHSVVQQLIADGLISVDRERVFDDPSVVHWNRSTGRDRSQESAEEALRYLTADRITAGVQPLGRTLRGAMIAIAVVLLIAALGTPRSAATVAPGEGRDTGR